MVIYMLLNLIEERCYVGQTKGTLKERVASHWEQARGGGTSILNEAMRKWDAPHFWEAVVLQRCTSEFALDDMETYWIDELSSRTPGVGYNARPGQGKELTEEQREYFRRAGREGAKASMGLVPKKPKRVSPLAGMTDEQKRAFFSECGKRGRGIAKKRAP